MVGIDFVKNRRDALRSIFGSALEHEFLEERRMQLDSYIARVCELTNAVDFFKHHADLNLKNFFCFDEHCQNVVSLSAKQPATLVQPGRFTHLSLGLNWIVGREPSQGSERQSRERAEGIQAVGERLESPVS